MNDAMIVFLILSFLFFLNTCSEWKRKERSPFSGQLSGGAKNRVSFEEPLKPGEKATLFRVISNPKVWTGKVTFFRVHGHLSPGTSSTQVTFFRVKSHLRPGSGSNKRSPFSG